MPKLIIMSQENFDITGLSVELNTDTGTAPEPTEQPEVQEHESIESLEHAIEKADDRVPLNKYMEEKKARKALEEQAEQLRQELESVRNHRTPTSAPTSDYDLSYLSEKHNVDEDVLRDIIAASSAITREQLEAEMSPRLAELDNIKRDKEKQKFESQFTKLVNDSISEMPEYADIIDKEDLKAWIKSGQYSKLTMPQLIEQKYGRFVGTKKAIDGGYTPGREAVVPSAENMTDKDWENIESNPELKKKWQSSLEDRLRKYM